MYSPEENEAFHEPEPNAGNAQPEETPQPASDYSAPRYQPIYNSWPVTATPPRRRSTFPYVLAALGAVLIGLIGLLGFSGKLSAPAATVQNATTTTVATAAPVPSGTTLTVRQVSEMVRPAVVQITTQQNLPDSSDPFGFGSSQNGSDQMPTGVGSGVIYDASGDILTNYHVVNGATTLLVALPDGRSFSGTVIGSDSQTDLAVVKIDPKGASLPVAQLGDSSQLHVGDGVVAIGNALALPGGPTVTSGVVSALDRSVTEPTSTSSQNASPFGRGSAATTSGPQLYGMIQTDAAINPGNSGGPLVNMQGQVVGIDTLVAGQAEPGLQAQGIGFAISINQAKTVAQTLVTGSKVAHPYLGISYEPLTPALAKRLGVNVTSGAVVATVVDGSPASQAGLQANTVITAVDGQALTGESQLGQIVNSHKPGDTVQLTVVTGNANGNTGGTATIKVTLGQRPTSN